MLMSVCNNNYAETSMIVPGRMLDTRFRFRYDYVDIHQTAAIKRAADDAIALANRAAAAAQGVQIGLF